METNLTPPALARRFRLRTREGTFHAIGATAASLAQLIRCRRPYVIDVLSIAEMGVSPTSVVLAEEGCLALVRDASQCAGGTVFDTETIVADRMFGLRVVVAYPIDRSEPARLS